MNKKALGTAIVIPLLTGGLAAILTGGAMEDFDTLYQPALSPPAWLFPIVWSLLYLGMGISSYLIYISAGKEQETTRTKKKQALTTYGYQLVVNFLWPVFFFSFGWYFFAFLWLVFLWILAAKMILEFGELSKTAALLNIPYLLWLSFAGYLNLGIWLLN